MTLRTKKPNGARHNLLWFEVKRDRFVLAETRYEANTNYIKYGPHYGRSLAVLERGDYTLTDVTDTGEPLDLDDQLESNPVYTEFVESLGSWGPPQTGDTVRGTVTLDGEYVFPNGIRDDNGDIFWFPTNTPFQVIARAKPAVPEDPQCDVIRVRPDGSEELWDHSQCVNAYHNGADRWDWQKLWEVAQGNGDKLYPLVTTRGPVIGG